MVPVPGEPSSSDGLSSGSWFVRLLGVRVQRKEEIYTNISASTTLRDGAYWLEIVFSASVATLGLSFNSPAVIIGAVENRSTWAALHANIFNSFTRLSEVGNPERSPI